MLSLDLTGEKFESVLLIRFTHHFGAPPRNIPDITGQGFLAMHEGLAQYPNRLPHSRFSLWGSNCRWPLGVYHFARVFLW